MTYKGDDYEMAECPLCENYDAHSRAEDGWLTCALCNTSWGGARLSSSDASRWLPKSPPLR